MISYARRQVAKQPILKKAAKRVLGPYVHRFSTFDDRYMAWAESATPDASTLAEMKDQIAQFSRTPVVSLLLPTYNTDHDFLRECLDSVLAQVYENWELCIVDDASTDDTVRTIIEEYATADTRIKYKFLKKNRHIADSTNEAAKLATGEYIGLLDHDDLLWSNALFEVVNVLSKDDADLLYTDEEKVSHNPHEKLSVFFKPDWNPEFMYSVNYITHFVVMKRELFERLGGMRSQYNGAQDWDFCLRASDITDKIVHVPKVVYSWRVHDQSTAKTSDAKPYVIEAQKAAITSSLERRGRSRATVEDDPEHPGYWVTNYMVEGNPRISIVIPSKNQFKVVKRCIDSIYEHTTYKNFEIIIVDTGSDDKHVLDWYESVKHNHTNIKVISWDEQPFSYARSCNEGAKHATGELLVMLNNDTEVITPNWLELLAGEAQQHGTGAVGCLLLYPDKKHIQHAGIGVGLGGVAGNMFSLAGLNDAFSQTQHLMLFTKHNVSAVTAACLMVKKEIFDEVGGFDEKYRITYNDVDLCLRLLDAGYNNIYTPHVKLVHHESISLGTPEQTKKRDTAEFQAAKKQFTTQWAKYVAHDPAINDNLDKYHSSFVLPPQHKR